MKGEILVGIGKETELDSIDFGYDKDGNILVKETLLDEDIQSLAVELISLGLARRVLTREGSSYILFNKDQFPEVELDDDYDPIGD